MPEERPALAENHSPDTNARRARAIVASLRSGDPGSEEVFDAFWELDALPVEDVRDALASWVGPLPDLERLDSATRSAHGLPPPPLRLRTLSVERDADILDLGPVAEEQLRLAGKSWDGVDLAPEERLDGEVEGSFAGTLERRVLADADAPGDAPLFDVLLFGEDSGVVFAAGKTSVIALIAYRKVEMRDRRTRVAIEEVLAAPKAPSSVEAELPSPTVATPATPATAKPKRAKVAKQALPRPSTREKAPAKKTAKKAAKKAIKQTSAKTSRAESARKPAAKTKRTAVRTVRGR